MGTFTVGHLFCFLFLEFSYHWKISSVKFVVSEMLLKCKKIKMTLTTFYLSDMAVNEKLLNNICEETQKLALQNGIMNWKINYRCYFFALKIPKVIGD